MMTAMDRGDDSDTRLRVVVVHSFYSSRSPSGENVVVDQQVSALRRSGHEVLLVEQRTDDRELARAYRTRSAFNVATGFGPNPRKEIEGFDPDVVHVHNLFPNFGRRWLSSMTAPVVATLHNYRPICPAGTLFRDGGICLDCVRRQSALPAVRHACYRASRLQTLPVALGTRFADDPVLSAASRLVVLSQTMHSQYVKAGVPAGKMQVVPNFLQSPPKAGLGTGPFVYIGRLTAEKGILDLLAEWPARVPLTVVGDGPLLAAVREQARGQVRVLGPVNRDRALELLGASRGLVFPSRWFEGFPMVYVEALALGTPVMAWKPSSVADLVARDGTGLVVHDLHEALETAEDTFEALRGRCRDVFERSYTERRWLTQMTSIYRSAALPAA